MWTYALNEFNGPSPFTDSAELDGGAVEVNLLFRVVPRSPYRFMSASGLAVARGAIGSADNQGTRRDARAA